MFWENFLSLCDAKNMSPNAVCAELKLSNATATKWKQGAMPTATTLRKIAQYFNVSVSSLLVDAKEKSPSISDEDIKVALFGGDGDVSDEAWEEVKRFAAYAKEKYGKK